MKRAKDHKLDEILSQMDSLQVEYPEELLSARRAAFLEEVERASLAAEAKPDPQDGKVIDLLKRMRFLRVYYPQKLLAARRADYTRRIAWMNWVSLWSTFQAALQEGLSSLAAVSCLGTKRTAGTALTAASLALVALVGYVLYENYNPLSNSFQPRQGIFQSGQILAPDAREVRIMCRPGLEPPLCLAGEYANDETLTYQRNGSARPAVAKDSKIISGQLHKASYVNDGLYGPGASWVSNSKNSWIKIDLGKAAKINTVTFGRDRLGELDDGDPGQFVIAVALSDDVYANGNHRNDDREYQPVFVSEQAGFEGSIEGAETVIAQFDPQVARYIKITFENMGTAIDEVEAFMALPPVAGSADPPSSGDEPSGPGPTSLASDPAGSSVPDTSTPVDTATSVPTDTAFPTETATLVPSPTLVPTSTDIPTSTAVPTNTPLPTRTPTPVPTDTPDPTRTPIPEPTDTPDPTRTPIPEPTDTPVSPETETPFPIEMDLPVSERMPSRAQYNRLPTEEPVFP